MHDTGGVVPVMWSKEPAFTEKTVSDAIKPLHVITRHPHFSPESSISVELQITSKKTQSTTSFKH